MTRRALPWTVLLLALLAAALWLAIGLGSREGQLVFDPDWLSALLDGDDSLQSKILIHWRAPRALAGLIVGAGLAMAGLVLQGLTRNPLADPYLLGISGGAGLAVVALHALPALVETAGWWLVPAAAFVGAQLATLLVLTLARGARGRLTILGLILAGVIINAMCAALMSFLLVRFDPIRLRITTLWLAGGIGYAPWVQLALGGWRGSRCAPRPTGSTPAPWATPAPRRWAWTPTGSCCARRCCRACSPAWGSPWPGCSATWA